ncbi:hypothetical protein QTP88_026300 [Uroleucon formosanum]
MSKGLAAQIKNKFGDALAQFDKLKPMVDASNIKPANIKPCEIRMKQNYEDSKFHAPHRISPQQRDELKTQLDKLNKANIIHSIITKFAAPAFLVKKKEKGSYRLVVSYKELNES